MRRSVVAFALVLLAADPLTAATEVVSGIHLLRGDFKPGSQPDGNSVIIEAPDGLIVVDTGRHATHTERLLDEAKAIGRPIVAVINTHWHLDHIGGNLVVRRSHPSARVYASAAFGEALTGFLANYRKQLQKMLEDPAIDDAAKKAYLTEIRLIEAGSQLAPDVVIAKSETRRIGGRMLQLGLATNAVTAGDVFILDERTGVLIAGDLVTLPAPFLDTACPSRWEASLDQLGGLDFDILIPGHGAPMTRRQFETYRSAFTALLTCASSDREKTACIDQWIDGTGSLMTRFDDRFTRNLMAYYVDLLRTGPARFEAACANAKE